MLGLNTFFLSTFLIFRQGRSIILTLDNMQQMFLARSIPQLYLILLAFVMCIQNIKLLLLIDYVVLNLLDIDFVTLNELRLQYRAIIILRLLCDVYVIFQQELCGEKHRAQHKETHCYGIRHLVFISTIYFSKNITNKFLN